MTPFAWDWKKPDYVTAFRWRAERIQRIRQDPGILPHLKLYYRENLAQFITDWGITVDPRNIELGLPSELPFILFPKQVEWVEWIVYNWKNRLPGITEKSRDMGISWLSIALACSFCIFYPGMVVGFGSRKEEYVDKLAVPKSLLEKARMFMAGLPPEFRGEWNRDLHAPHMRIMFPDTGSLITGEAGDSIGRGDRTSIYFVDEAAHLERPHLIDASLSATTNCRQDLSSVAGMGNSFAQRRHGGKIRVFTFHWRDDPRKDSDWYNKQVNDLPAVTVAQEIDINYSASVEGVLIPSVWVQAAVDAHKKLGFEPTGVKRGALDVADQGIDANAFCGRHGVVIQRLKTWSGKDDDIFGTVVKTFAQCDELEYETFYYDADGLGAGVRGDARVLNETRQKDGRNTIMAEPFRGSGAVHDPDGEMVPKRKNKDFFANMKAQAWWMLRIRFQKTYRAVVEGMAYNPDELISISSDLPELAMLLTELSQPTYDSNTAGKIIVNKAPDGTKSPNRADAVMIAFQPGMSSSELWAKLGAQ